jgi:carboxylesterase type B
LFEFRSQKGLESVEERPFHRMAMISNAIPAQPKTVEECQNQFDEVCEYFDIPKSSHGKEKLSKLRDIDAKTLVEAIMNLKHHTFRPVTDESFIQSGIIDYLRNGTFAQDFRRHGFKLLIGEVLNEETLYAVTNPPDPDVTSLHLQVSNYYAATTTDRVLQHYTLPQSTEKSAWASLYGNIIADGQVRAPSRFLANSLLEHGVRLEDIWRYRVAYRLSFINEKIAPKSFGVAHAMDKPFWK